MLVGKFIVKNKIDDLRDKNGKPADPQHVRIQGVVSKEFDHFIGAKTFTQNNLRVFESGLLQKLKGILTSRASDCRLVQRIRHQEMEEV